MISVIIPSRNEQPYLEKTILNVLENAGGDIEIIVILDGWLPSPQIVIPNADNKVIWVHHQESEGQRASVNEGARIASGEYIMKLDAHCTVGKDFDLILARDCEYDMTMIPAMFNLDILTWKPREFENWDKAARRGKLNPYMYIGWKGGHLRALYYPSKMRKKIYDQGKLKPVDQTMCCMGPAFFMHRERFFELGGMDEKHGQWGQMGVEVACKAWLSGGRLMVNKNTWFAHYFRGGGVPEGHKSGFPYKLSQGAVDRARVYSDDLWINDKWEKQTKKMRWLVKKFDPPTWEYKVTSEDRMELFSIMFNHIHRRQHDALWRGVPLWKFPTDISLYHEAIFEKKPDTIIEIGTAKGGSSLYFQDMLDICNPGGTVITVDIRDRLSMERDDRITYAIGDSTDKKIVKLVKSLVSGKVMVVIDGDHKRATVKWDLHNYAPLVTSGQYLVVEDCYTDKGLWGPGEAREWFLKAYKSFKQTDNCTRYMVGMTMGGWLIKDGA